MKKYAIVIKHTIWFELGELIEVEQAVQDNFLCLTPSVLRPNDGYHINRARLKFVRKDKNPEYFL